MARTPGYDAAEVRLPAGHNEGSASEQSKALQWGGAYEHKDAKGKPPSACPSTPKGSMHAGRSDSPPPKPQSQTRSEEEGSHEPRPCRASGCFSLTAQCLVGVGGN